MFGGSSGKKKYTPRVSEKKLFVEIRTMPPKMINGRHLNFAQKVLLYGIVESM